MKYMLLIYGNEAAMMCADEKAGRADDGAYGAYSEAMKKAGVMSAASGCARPRMPRRCASPTVSRRCSNGPYAETKEQLGGYYMIEAPDLDAALSWASRCPGAHSGRSRCGRSGPCSRDAARGRRRRATPPRRWRAGATASSSPSLRRARVISPAPRTPCPSVRGALDNWPEAGVPTIPEAWLLSAARRKQLDAVRRRQTRSEPPPNTFA